MNLSAEKPSPDHKNWSSWFSSWRSRKHLQNVVFILDKTQCLAFPYFFTKKSRHLFLLQLSFFSNLHFRCETNLSYATYFLYAFWSLVIYSYVSTTTPVTFIRDSSLLSSFVLLSITVRYNVKYLFLLLCNRREKAKNDYFEKEIYKTGILSSQEEQPTHHTNQRPIRICCYFQYSNG